MPYTRSVRTFLDPRHQRLAAEAEAFAKREIASLPAPQTDSEARLQAREILELLGGAGLLRWAVPAAYGGSERGPDLRACCLIREALAAASPLADSVFALQCLGSMPLVLAADEALKRDLLPRIAAGELMTAFALTEPGAGSDPAGMETRAERDGDAYTLTGGKHLITNAGVADLYTVFAVTDAEAGNRGISCFAVDAEAPGLRFVRAQVLSEPHPLGEIAFNSCRVPALRRVGEEGAGFRLAMATLDRLRASVAAGACGMASRALEEALGHALERRQFGQVIADFQLVQAKLARMATELTAARLLTYRAAYEADALSENGRVTLESAMAKLHATETAQRVVDDAVQILGGAGVLADHPVDRLYRAVRALRIYEGTSEIQHLVIARELVRRHRGEGRS